FSAMSSHLEHYLMPAVPAAALMTGRLCDLWASGEGSGSRVRLLFPGVVLLCGLLALALLPSALRAADLGPLYPGFRGLSLAAGICFVVWGGAALVLGARQRWAGALGCAAVAALLFSAVSAYGRGLAEPYLSWRPLVRSLPAALLAESEVAYEAGEEYQLCGALNVYLNRRLTLLEPPGFIPPTYLQADVDRLFVKRDRFWREWAQGRRRILLFSDPEKAAERPDAFPQPNWVVARAANRLVLTNRPPTPQTPSPATGSSR
ncbi:MAG TPA: hypothetical protein VFU47_07760, partial [Armatimonadota bacterium]|nr:hypothetical protein [Armatimonadota bacterium]